MIKYDKLLKIFEEKKITSYTLKKNKIISQYSFKNIKDGGTIDTTTIDHLCKYLKCQPGDILEYVDEDEEKGE